MGEINCVGAPEIAPGTDRVKENTSREKRDALFEWEDDGGARRSDSTYDDSLAHAGGQPGATRDVMA
jgi:hypothetical protein